MNDARLKFYDINTAWRAGTKQNLLGSDFVTYDPTIKIDEQPKIVEFELLSNQSFLFGPMTRFQIVGGFQTKTSATTGDWEPATAADWENVVVEPFFLGNMIKEIALFSGNQKLCTTDEAQHIAPYLESYLYNYMDPLAKKLMCPQECHPGNGVPNEINSWGLTGKEWKEYASKIFTGEDITFDYIPMHVFPFFQRANFLVDNNHASPLPMPALGKITVRISFNDKLDNIFKKKEGNLKLYKFAFTSIQLLVEEARLNPTFERNFYNKKTLLPYSGVTKVMIAETIAASVLSHRARFQNVAFPEGLFIFALPKKCLSGTHTYQDNTTGNVFSPHNIEKVNFTFNGQTYFMKDPNMSMIENEYMEVKSLIDHLGSPPFGMTLDPKKVTLKSIKDGGKNTPYPHVYLNFCNFADKTRLVPLMNDGSILAGNHDLDLYLTFKEGGATQDVVYLFYLFYTDTNIVLDMKNKTFYSPYVTK